MNAIQAFLGAFMKCEKCNNWVDCQYKEKGYGFCLCKDLFTYTKLDDDEYCEDFVLGKPMSDDEYEMAN